MVMLNSFLVHGVRMIRLRNFALLTVFGLHGCGSMEQLITVPAELDNARVLPYQTELHQRSVHTFDPVQLERKLVVRHIQPRVENIYLLLDQTVSMSGEYRGVALSKYAKEITRRLLRTLPENTFEEYLFLLDERREQGSALLLEREQALSNLELNSEIAAIGTNDLATAIDELTKKLSEQEERSAIVMVTGWDQISDDVSNAVMRLRQNQQTNAGFHVRGGVENWSSSNDQGVCIYVIGVGNRMSRTVLDGPESCGFSTSADKVAQPRDMAHFVERAFYLDPADSDGDGIYDYLDRCPSTVPGKIVGYDGCDRFMVVRGDSDK